MSLIPRNTLTGEDQRPTPLRKRNILEARNVSRTSLNFDAIKVPPLNLFKEKMALDNSPIGARIRTFASPRNDFSSTPSLTTRQKGIKTDHLSSNEFDELKKYANSLESKLKIKDYELERLVFMNKFLSEAHKSREEVIKSLTEENRRLKDVIEHIKHYPHDKSKSIRESLQFINTPSPHIKKPSGYKHMEQAITIQRGESSHKRFASSLENLSQRQTGQANTIFFGYDIGEDVKSSSMLRLSEAEAATIFFDTEERRLLENLVTHEDYYAHLVWEHEDHSLLRIHSATISLLRDGKRMFEMVFKLKRLAESANLMNSSLVLHETFENIVEQICECLNCDRASIFMLDHNKGELWSLVAKGTSTIRIPWDSGIVGEVAKSAKPLIIHNAYRDKRFNKEQDLLNRYKTETLICVPIFDQQKSVIGVCQAINKKDKRLFTDDDEGLLSILATLAGCIILNSLSFDKEKHFHKRLKQILDLGIYLNSQNGTREVMVAKAQEKLQSIMNVEHAKIFVYDEETDKLRAFDKNKTWSSFDKTAGIAGHVFMTGRYEQFTDPYTHHLYNGTVDIETSVPLICWPIRNSQAHDKIVGVLEIINLKGLEGLVTTQKSRLSQYEIQALEFFSKQLAQTIVNSENYNKSSKPITDLRNNNGENTHSVL